MKKLLSLLLLAASLTTACKKDSSSTPPTTTGPTTLLTKIINNTTGNAGFGKAFIEFSYNGKQLTKEVRYEYKTDGSISNAETDVFNYNSQGTLTGTTITNTSTKNNGIIGSTITVNGSNITRVKWLFANNVIADDITFTYQNGNLATSTSINSGLSIYSYDANGNNSQRVTDHPLINHTFDRAINLTSTIPYWEYFAYSQFSDIYALGVPLYPGANNIVAFSDGSTNMSYSYDYTNDHYPSASTSTVTLNGKPISYQYQYTQVN